MILCQEGIFYHFHNVMYTPFLSVDETNNDRGRGFFIPVARWKSNKSIKALPIQTDGNIGSPLFTYFPIGKKIYIQAYKNRWKNVHEYFTTRQLYVYDSVTQKPESVIQISDQ